MTNIVVKINGEPVGKGRPKFIKETGRTYTPKKTRDYEKHIQDCYLEQNGLKKLSGDISAEIHAYFKIPKGTSKANRQLMLCNKIKPSKKPDIDNIEKIIFDGLNGVAYDDDKQIIDVECHKRYADEPCVIVYLSEVK